MNIDQHIKRELESEAAEIDEILAEEKGLFSLATGIFKGGMRYWVILVNIVILVVTAGLLWSGYQFYIAETLDYQVFWGVVLIVALQAQVSMKLWLFIEMARISTYREIKHTEIAITKMGNRLEDKLDRLLTKASNDA